MWFVGLAGRAGRRVDRAVGPSQRDLRAAALPQRVHRRHVPDHSVECFGRATDEYKLLQSASPYLFPFVAEYLMLVMECVAGWFFGDAGRRRATPPTKSIGRRDRDAAGRWNDEHRKRRATRPEPVSYTHLTLPTILRV